jgi:two-component system, sensor histidine kinase and response regulator
MNYIDDKVLDNLRALQAKTGKDLLGKLIRLYLDTTPKMLSELSNTANKDHEATAAVAHTLKSSSANIGAMTMSEICKKIEYMNKDGAPSDSSLLSSLVSDALKTYDQTAEELRSLLAKAS